MPVSTDDIRATVAEFVATTLFVFIGTYVAATGLDPALAFGFAIAVLVNSVADVSGGHLNPAVTLAMIVTKNIAVLRGALYMGAQFAGGVLGAALTRACIGAKFSGGAGVNMINPVVGVSDFEAFLSEAMFTALLVYVVMSVAIKEQVNVGSGALAPYLIGLTVSIGHFCLIPITNCSINPARSFGPSLIQNVWDDHWIFFLGPFTGSLIGPACFYAIYGTVTPDAIETAGGDYDLDGQKKAATVPSTSSADNVAQH